MEVIIKGEAKEIAALLLEIAERHNCDPCMFDAEDASEHIKGLFQKHFNTSSEFQG